jgi:hypothetical protein
MRSLGQGWRSPDTGGVERGNELRYTREPDGWLNRRNLKRQGGAEVLPTRGRVALLPAFAILTGVLMVMFAAIRHCRIVGGIVHRHLHCRMMAHGASASEYGHAREALNRDRETE